MLDVPLEELGVISRHAKLKFYPRKRNIRRNKEKKVRREITTQEWTDVISFLSAHATETGTADPLSRMVEQILFRHGMDRPLSAPFVRREINNTFFLSEDVTLRQIWAELKRGCLENRYLRDESKTNSFCLQKLRRAQIALEPLAH